MGQLQTCCRNNDLPAENEGDNTWLAFKSNLKYRFHGDFYRDTISHQLMNIKCMFPESNDDIHNMPDQIRNRQIEQLLDLRTLIYEKMLIHSDRYNGTCQFNEKVVEWEYPHSKIMGVCPCEEGSRLNKNMDEVGFYLMKLGFSEIDSNTINNEVQRFKVYLIQQI